MKIAFISYEYPPDTALGGIGTYVYQVSKMMTQRGHHVEVFCGSLDRTISEEYEGVRVHRILSKDRRIFCQEIVPCFTKRHIEISFNLIESPEYMADGLNIKLIYPTLPLIVKLHTPTFLLYNITFKHEALSKKARFIIAGILKNKKINKPYWKHVSNENDAEYRIVKLADQVHTPSISLGDIVSRKWKIKRNDIQNVPYPYIPEEKLLYIPLDTYTNTVTFIGRFEIRKGLVALCKAIPLVLKKHTEVKFRFVGSNSSLSPITGMDMRSYIEFQLKNCKDNLEFAEVKHDEIDTVYSSTAICVYPSLWENFPNVCLEAMSSGRAIIGSKEGGMKDMLENPPCGMLINPTDYTELANAINFLIENKNERIRIGTIARQIILDSYNMNIIGTLMENKYAEVINKFKVSTIYKV